MIDTETWAKLPLRGVLFDVTEPQAINRTAGGSMIVASLGDPRWIVRADLALSTARAADTWRPALSRLRRSGLRLALFDPYRNGPAADPGGVILGASTVTVDTLDADGVSLRLDGLPAGYILTPGDHLGVTVGGVPYLFRAVSAAVADGAGLTPLFEVEPWLPPEITIGAAVVLVRPVIHAQVTDYTPASQVFTAVGAASVVLEQVV